VPADLRDVGALPQFPSYTTHAGVTGGRAGHGRTIIPDAMTHSGARDAPALGGFTRNLQRTKAASSDSERRCETNRRYEIENAPNSCQPSNCFGRIVGVMFMRVNSKCATRCAHHEALECSSIVFRIATLSPGATSVEAGYVPAIADRRRHERTRANASHDITLEQQLLERDQDGEPRHSQ
jgi:hypothetical protein